MGNQNYFYCDKSNQKVVITQSDSGIHCSESRSCRNPYCPIRFLAPSSSLTSDRVKKANTIIWVFVALAALAIVIGFSFRALFPVTDEKLIERLGSENPGTRFDAALVLAERKNSSALVPLQEALQSDLPGDRSRAIEALVLLGDPLAIPDICRLLDHADLAVVYDAAKALTEIGDESVIEPLYQALRSRPAEERWALAIAYADYRDERAIPYLLEAIVVDDIVQSHYEELLQAISYQGADPVPALADSVLNGGPGANRLAEIEKSTGQPIKAMHDLIANRDLQTLARCYLFFIYLDQDSSNSADNDRLTLADQAVLVEALFAYGDKNMAQSFANFRLHVWNPVENLLNDAAYVWAEEHGYTIVLKDR